MGEQEAPSKRCTVYEQLACARRRTTRLKLEQCGSDSRLVSCAKKMIARLDAPSQELFLMALLRVDKSLPVSSACSGCELQAFCGDALFSLAEGIDLRYDLVFSCEKDQKKADFISSIVHEARGQHSCIFVDYGDLAQSRSKCWIHCQDESTPNATCPIVPDDRPLPTIHIAGFSCKDLSKVKSAPQDLLNRALLDNGTTATTLDNLLAHLASWKPACYLGENAEELAVRAHASYHMFQEMLLKRNYVGDVFLLNASDFGSAARRPRGWIVAFHMDKCGINAEEGRVILSNIHAFVQKMKTGSTDFHDRMLDNTHPLVLQELARRQCSRKEETSGWESRFVAHLRKTGTSMSDCYPPALVRASPWYSTIPDRGQQTMGYLIKMIPDWSVVDSSQDIRRPYHSSGSTMYALTTVVNPWVRRANRPMIGVECLLLQGFPEEVLMKRLDMAVTDNDSTANDPAHVPYTHDLVLKDLAGNAFSAEVVLAVLAGLLTYAPPAVFQKIVKEVQPQDEEAPVANSADDVSAILNCIC